MDDQVTLVPQKAVVTFAGVSKVFTMNEGKAVEVKVETGQQRGADVEIVKGLSGVVPVVIDGAGKLAMGTPITLSPKATTTVSAD
jgi:hypothetical protein